MEMKVMMDAQESITLMLYYVKGIMYLQNRVKSILEKYGIDDDVAQKIAYMLWNGQCKLSL